ncbi:TonB-dependent receptor [Thalassotalea sp. LPB0316]|uniref:TonB-dependent receptor n=1 Tax=Thalassotalea sp. LPB0316 TaxID=2769490 RepID=UPI0018685C4B|nr:TonB-dependent receptor [Thalassotalea sp. LPB0316]QOL25621.1 TonB-dependent receptor [Thalassotalea sp. LPB0316]
MSTPKKSTALATVFGLCLLSPLSAAQENSIETITVTNTRDIQPLNEVSRAIALISQNTIEQSQVDHIQQVLNQTTGVNIDRNSGQEMLLAIRSPVLSGAGACGSFLTLENGIALRPTGFCNVNELFESHYELAESIEVLKGPSSAFYGSNGLHGSINIVAPASFSRQPFVKATFGQWDYQQLSFLANSENLALSSSLSHSGGYRDDSGFDQQKVSLAHQYQAQHFELTSFLTATNLNQETAGYIVGKDSYKDEEVRRSNPNPEAYRDASAIRISQRYQFDQNLVVSPYARYSQMAFLQHFVPGKPVEKNRHYSVGLQSQYRLIENENTRVDLGIDGEFASISLLEQQFSPTQGSAFLQATIPNGKHYDYEVDALTFAGFGQVQYQLSSQWLLSAGARLETIHYDYQNQMNSGRVDEIGNPCGFGGCRFNRPESRDDRFTMFSPKLGAIYQVNANTSTYINLSHGFRAPQTTELYRLQREQSVSDLSPEELLAFDMGYRQTLGNSQIELEAYWYDKSNVILRDNDFFYISDGETSHRGIEAAFNTQWLTHWQLNGNVSYSRHTYENNPNLSQQTIIGNDIANAPRWLSNLGVSYQSTNYQVAIQGQYVGEYYLNPENSASYDGHFLLHLRAQFDLADELQVFVNLDNLFDKYYAERANYTSFTQERYFPGLPRNLKLSMRYNF